jgi:hypothetical protein
MKMLKPGREKFASHSQRKGLGTQNSMFTERIQPLPLDICKRSVRQCVSKRETHWGLLFFLHVFLRYQSILYILYILSPLPFSSPFSHSFFLPISIVCPLFHAFSILLLISSPPPPTLPILLIFSLFTLYSFPYLRLLLHS